MINYEQDQNKHAAWLLLLLISLDDHILKDDLINLLLQNWPNVYFPLLQMISKE